MTGGCPRMADVQKGTCPSPQMPHADTSKQTSLFSLRRGVALHRRACVSDDGSRERIVKYCRWSSARYVIRKLSVSTRFNCHQMVNNGPKMTYWVQRCF